MKLILQTFSRYGTYIYKKKMYLESNFTFFRKLHSAHVNAASQNKDTL